MKRILSLVLVFAFTGIMILPSVSHFNSNSVRQNAQGATVPPWPGCDTNPQAGTSAPAVFTA